MGKEWMGRWFGRAGILRWEAVVWSTRGERSDAQSFTRHLPTPERPTVSHNVNAKCL
jgi:hypothetical protein